MQELATGQKDGGNRHTRGVINLLVREHSGCQSQVGETQCQFKSDSRKKRPIPARDRIACRVFTKE